MVQLTGFPEPDRSEPLPGICVHGIGIFNEVRHLEEVHSAPVPEHGRVGLACDLDHRAAAILFSVSVESDRVAQIGAAVVTTLCRGRTPNLPVMHKAAGLMGELCQIGHQTVVEDEPCPIACHPEPREHGDQVWSDAHSNQLGQIFHRESGRSHALALQSRVKSGHTVSHHTIRGKARRPGAINSPRVRRSLPWCVLGSS